MSSRIYIPIDPNYVNWSVWESLREFLQNSKDEDTLGHNMWITHDPHVNVLVIRNTGSNISREHLVLGNTKKRNDSSQIGMFGEGFKLAVISLIGLGKSVVITNNNEIWNFSIGNLPEFNNAMGLIVDIDTYTESKDTSVMISGITKEEWEEASANVLWLTVPRNKFTSSYGDILLDPEYKGRVYIKGIFVSNNDNYSYGYNFTQVTTDRDRRIPQKWEVVSSQYNAWLASVVAFPEAADLFIDLIESGAQDFGSQFGYDYASVEFKNTITKAYKNRFGKAFPVTSMSDALVAENAGYETRMVEGGKFELYSRCLTTEILFNNSIKLTVKRIFNIKDITTEQMNNLLMAIEILSRGNDGIKLDSIKVVEFTDSSVRGKYDQGEICISHKELDDMNSLIYTLLHEYCHVMGMDNSAAHYNAQINTLIKALLHYAK